MKARPAVLVSWMALVVAGSAMGAGDPVKGAKLHDDCLGCHGTELYVPPRARVKTLEGLKKATEKWNDRMNPKFSKQEIEDLVAYMNRDFYRFTK